MMSEKQMQGSTRTISVQITVPAHLSGNTMSRMADAVGGVSNSIGADRLGPMTISMYDPSEFDEESDEADATDEEDAVADEDAAEGEAAGKPICVSSIGVAYDQRGWDAAQWFAWARSAIHADRSPRVGPGGVLGFQIRLGEDGNWSPAWRIEGDADWPGSKV